MNPDDVIPTPPVIETGITPQQASAEAADLKTAGAWEGPERRRVTPLSAAIEQASARMNRSPAPSSDRVVAIVALGAGLALLCLVLVSQFRLADRISSGEAEARRFREAIICFLVESSRTPGPAGTAEGADILTRCGFINVPGSKQK